MRPFLFTIGSAKVPSFFFFIMVATLVATFYAYWVAKKKGLREEVALDMGIIGMLAGVIGSRIFHILVEAPGYYWEKPLRVFEFWRGGFVSWGGFLGIGICFAIYFRMKRLPPGPYFDLLGVTAPIIKFFIRVACLLTGCCYGEPTDLPWAITFTDPASTAYYYFPNIPLHPVQVYSMIHAALLFAFVNWFYFKKQKQTGETICLLAMGWSLPRAFLEFFRGDLDRGVYFGERISTGQIMGVLVFAVAATVYWVLRKNKHPYAP